MIHQDLDGVRNALISVAKELLTEHGEFYPFAASMSLSGDVSRVAGTTGDKNPKAQGVINLLVVELKRRADDGEIRTAGICIDVKTSPPGSTEMKDAICTLLEHEDGEAVVQFLPYEIDQAGHIKYGEVFSVQGENNFFESAEE
jgi:hypothetical protein